MEADSVHDAAGASLGQKQGMPGAVPKTAGKAVISRCKSRKTGVPALLNGACDGRNIGHSNITNGGTMRRPATTPVLAETVQTFRLTSSPGETNRILASAKTMLEDCTSRLQGSREHGADYARKFCDIVLEMLGQSTARHVLLPMNYLLWFHALGSSETERQRMFIALAAHIGRILHLKKTQKAVPLGEIPITRRIRDIVNNPAVSFHDGRNMDFNTLQAMLTTLCYGVYGRRDVEAAGKHVESWLAHSAVVQASPLIAAGLSPLESGNPVPYMALVSRRNPVFSTMLFSLARPEKALLMLLALGYRMSPMRESGTKVMTKQDMIARALVFIMNSANDSPDACRKSAAAYSNIQLW